MTLSTTRASDRLGARPKHAQPRGAAGSLCLLKQTQLKRPEVSLFSYWRATCNALTYTLRTYVAALRIWASGAGGVSGCVAVNIW